MKQVAAYLALAFMVVMLIMWFEYIGEQNGRADQMKRDAKEIAYLKSLKTVPATTCTATTAIPAVTYCIGRPLPPCPPDYLCMVPQ